ncbi:MAG: TraM recognition domain-containing protein [Cyanobacteria bacterium P01_E01_bin.34]
MAETTSQSASQSITHQLGSFATSPNGLLLIGCVTLLALLGLIPRKTKRQIARGKFAGARERACARKLAIAQLKQQTHNEVALWIGEPPKAKTVKSRGKSQYIHPPHAKTFYVPDAQRGVLVCGGPGSGKSFSAIEPLVRSSIRQGFPILLYDFKYPRQTSRLAGLAREHGYEVSMFAPGYPESVTCNPLDFLDSEGDAETARQLAEVLNANFKRISSSAGSVSADNPFFDNAGVQLTEAILMLAKGSRYPDITTCTCLLQLENLAARLSEAELNYWVKTSFGQLIATAGSPETIGSIISTAFVNFNRFMKPGLLSAFCGKTTMPLDLQGRQMLVFGMDRQRRDVVGPLVATILHLIVERNVSVRRSRPLVVALDELTTFYLPRLGHWLNESREDGFVGLLGFQNLAQLERMWGKEGARIVMAGAGTKMCFNPQEFEAAETFSRYLGEEDVRLKQKSRGHSGGKGSSNVSDQDRTRKLFDTNQFLTLPTGYCIAVSPGLANQQQASLPARLAVSISRRELREVEHSRASFERDLLRLRRKHQTEPMSEGELKSRYDEAERLLPETKKASSPFKGFRMPGP